MLKKFSVSVAVIAAIVLGIGAPAQAEPEGDILNGRTAAEFEAAREVAPEPVPAPAPQTLFTIAVVKNDAFSKLVQTYCGRSDWQNVSFPGRDKNVIREGEIITIDCVAVVASTPEPVYTPAAAGICGGATWNYWGDTQRAHAFTIVRVGISMGFPRDGLIIALMTAMQESSLNNYGWLGDRNDHDSQGLFQQRPSMGWGTVAQVTDPVYAATKFYSVLATKNWQGMSKTLAAQSVQISAFPYAYAKWEHDATVLVDNC